MAKARHLSLNEFLIQELASATTVGRSRKHRSFQGIAGTWVDDPEFDKIVESQRQIDEDLWR